MMGDGDQVGGGGIKTGAFVVHEYCLWQKP